MNALTEQLRSEFSTPLNAAAQIFGLLPLFISFFTFIFRDRKHAIMTKTTVDFLFTIHFFLLGETVGGCINSVNTVRDVVFSQKGKRRWASHWLIPVLFCGITVAVALLRWEKWYNILPMLGSVLAVIGFWCSDVKNIRKFNIPATLLWLVYSIMICSISNLISNLISIGSITVGWIKSKKAKSEESDNREVKSEKVV